MRDRFSTGVVLPLIATDFEHLGSRVRTLCLVHVHANYIAQAILDRSRYMLRYQGQPIFRRALLIFHTFEGNFMCFFMHIASATFFAKGLTHGSI